MSWQTRFFPWESFGPKGERALVLRGRSSDEIEATLARGYDWLERGRRDLVEALHDSRRSTESRRGDSLCGDLDAVPHAALGVARLIRDALDELVQDSTTSPMISARCAAPWYRRSLSGRMV